VVLNCKVPWVYGRERKGWCFDLGMALLKGWQLGRRRFKVFEFR